MSNGIVDLAQLAEKQIKRANTLNTIGGILGGLGSLANSVNAIYQMSKGRNPLPIGSPVEAIGGTISGLGKFKQEQGQRNAALGTINKLHIDEPQKQLLAAAINSGESGAAFKGAFDVMAAERQAPFKNLDAVLKIAANERADKNLKIKESKEALLEKSASKKYQEDINNAQAISSTLDSLENTLATLKPGRVGGSIEKMRGLVNNPKLKAYNTDKSLLLSNIARNLGGEKGVLTDQDISRIEKGFPMPTDSEEERSVAFQKIRDLLNTRVAQYKQNQAAFAPSFISSHPPGATHTVPGSDGKLHYTDGINDLGVAE